MLLRGKAEEAARPIESRIFRGSQITPPFPTSNIMKKGDTGTDTDSLLHMTGLLHFSGMNRPWRPRRFPVSAMVR